MPIDEGSGADYEEILALTRFLVDEVKVLGERMPDLTQDESVVFRSLLVLHSVIYAGSPERYEQVTRVLGL